MGHKKHEVIFKSGDLCSHPNSVMTSFMKFSDVLDFSRSLPPFIYLCIHLENICFGTISYQVKLEL
jgi:hypothetical protein